MISDPGPTPAAINTASPALREPAKLGPDWVLYGERTADGRVAVVASTALNSAELRYERDVRLPNALLGAPELGKPRIYLTVEMKAYVMVVADAYDKALWALFDQWSPDGNQPALAAAPDRRSGQ